MAMENDFSGEDLLNDLRKWVSAEALKFDNVQKYDLKIYGSDDKGEHYGSDIAFVDMSVENFDGERREYKLVIKYGPRNKQINENLPIRSAFEREIEIYSKLMPCFHKFQQQKNLPLFDSAPKCYLTKFTDTEEVIILENLKPLGYSVHDRKTAMDLDHIKLVLKAYAEWHALSFAFKDQNQDEFSAITDGLSYHPLNDFMETENGKMFNVGQQLLYDILEEAGDIELLQKYKEKLRNLEATTLLRQLLDMQETQSVVLHGDCWNNNFIFKYENIEGDPSDKLHCTKVALLDFQISTNRSPAFDLGHFIYAVSSEEELSHFTELIEYYYKHLADFVKIFGSNPEKIFTYSDLMCHLKKYSIFGALFNPTILLFALAEKENAPDFGKTSAIDSLKVTAEKEEYKRRAIAVAKHFVEYEY